MKRIGRVLVAFKTTLLSLRYAKTAVPFLCYFLFKLCLISLYTSGAWKALDAFWKLFTPGMNTEALAHYPDRLLFMPATLGRLDLALEILLFVLAQATTMVLFAALARRERLDVGASARAAGKKYVPLAIAAAIASVVLFAAFRYPAAFLGRLVGIPRGLEATLSALLGLVIQSFFLFAMPFILFEGHSAFASIAQSFRFASRHFLEAFTLVFVPFILTVPTILLGINSELIAYRISPESLVHVQIAGEVVELFTAYLLMGALTTYFLETRNRGETR